MSLAVEMRGITKTFPNVVANDNIDLSVNRGEVHGLLGENGAGKTVLMSMLYGLLHPDSGRIFVNGKEVQMVSPATAIKLGIGMVHQHFMLVPDLTVAENIVLGREQTKNLLFLDRKKILDDVRDCCKEFGFDVDPGATVHSLPVGIQQRVEILKVLHRGADILILDEPTSVLTPQESEELFRSLYNMRRQGKTVIFISHKLKEVLRICDRITVLNHGKVVGTIASESVTMEELAKMMVGRDIVFTFDKNRALPAEEVLRVENVSAFDDRGLPALRNVSFEIRRSEILGMAGVEGNGQTELVDVLMGLREVSSGKVVFLDREITNLSTRERMKLGVSFIPEDRARGLLLDFSVAENLILGSQNQEPFHSGFARFNLGAITEYAEQLTKAFEIRTPNIDTEARNLSGGTQQRVVLARELSRKPKLVIASQPTRGLDVGATEYVRSKLVEISDSGSAVLLISADLDEIMALSDRIAVLFEGRIVALTDASRTSEEELGLSMAGGRIA